MNQTKKKETPAIEHKALPAPKKKAPAPTPQVSQEFVDELFENIKPKAKAKPKAKPKATQQDTTTTSAPAPVKKTITKTKTNVTTGTQIPPSKIGIQRLRELLEEAKNKEKLSVADTSNYMKLYDDWKGSKGDKATKYEKIKGLR